jgi:hypothetical protein
VNAEPQVVAVDLVLLNLRHVVSDVVNLMQIEVFDFAGQYLLETLPD